MKRNRRQENLEGLEPLARQAAHYAPHMKRTTTSVPPMVNADTDEGYIFCMPKNVQSSHAAAALFEFSFRATGAGRVAAGRVLGLGFALRKA